MDTHVLECDVLVAGGGPAGVPCAIAAARNGAKVVLCHNRSVLGGNASSEVRMHILGADGGGGRSKELETEAREGGIIEEIRLENSVRNPQRSASMLDLILYEKCRELDNLTLLLNTTVTGADVQNGVITKAFAERQSTEDQFEIHAKVFVDCTGDGRLGKEAGAPYRMGREGKEEFGEQLAQDIADDKKLGSTLLFQARNMGAPVPYIAPKWARKFTEADLKLRPHATSGTDRGLEYGYWWCEWGGTLDTIKDNELIRDELLSIMLGVWDHIKNGGDHNADNWALDWFGFLPGKRESRRFIGQHILTECDLLETRVFEDAIAYGGWGIDIHPPEGVDAPDLKPAVATAVPLLYDIPLRSCVSERPVNLMFAGRNISATHVAFASTRVMATCAVIGQGVGTAAAHAVHAGVHPNALAGNPEHMRHIQQQLLKDDAYLTGIYNDDPFDLARRANLTASSEQTRGATTNVISGQSRAISGPKGVKPGRSIEGTNRWMSDPEQGLPAWLELQWDEEIEPNEIRIVFDTGMHRVLTLSHSDDFVKKMQYGKAQLETVRDYTIESMVDGQWHTIIEEHGNYQRLRVHKLTKPLRTDRIRLHVHATNGIDHARVCEIRVY